MLLSLYVGPGDVDDVIQNLNGIYVYPKKNSLQTQVLMEKTTEKRDW